MCRALQLLCLLALPASALGTSIGDDVIEPSEQILRFVVPREDLVRFGDAVEAYASSVRLYGLRHESPKLGLNSMLAGYDQNRNASEITRAVFVVYNVETECAGLLIRVWDDEKSDLAAQMAEQAALFLKDRFEHSLMEMQEQQCKVTF